jgi:hypothetical protein
MRLAADGRLRRYESISGAGGEIGLVRYSTVANPCHFASTAQAARLIVNRLRGRAVQRASHDSQEHGAFCFARESCTTL